MVKFFAIVAITAGAIGLASATGHGYGHDSHDDGHHAGHAYKFGYEITDPHGAKNSRQESDDGYGNRHGSYSIYDKDGRKRVVEYTADKSGFHAKIHSNEPGVAPHHAADAVYHHEGGYHHEPSHYEGHQGGHHGGHYESHKPAHHGGGGHGYSKHGYGGDHDDK